MIPNVPGNQWQKELEFLQNLSGNGLQETPDHPRRNTRHKELHARQTTADKSTSLAT